MTLTETQIRHGVWHGVLQGGSGVPQLEVRHLDKVVPDLELSESDAGWNVKVPIPLECISEGVQTFSIFNKLTSEPVAQFTLIAGEVLGDDIRAEMALLRAELDMLKRAFRRHCAETT